MVTQTKSAKTTQRLGVEFAKKIKSGGVVCLFGDLGAGKTTFVQGVARGLGIKERIISPTFILIRRYKINAQKYFYHIDLYRLDSIDQVRGVGIGEIINDSGNIVFIEWPEKIASLFPKKRWEIKLENLGENKRKISYEAIH